MLLMFGFLSRGYTQHVDPLEEHFLDRDVFAAKIDSLENHYGQKKTFDTEFKLPCLVALSHYPELRDIKIVFRHHPKVEALVRVMPFNKYLFTRSRKKRAYFVDFNPNLEIFDKYSFNAMVGVIGHELAHVSEFAGKGFMGITGVGIGHISKKYVAQFERETDRTALQHGLEYQLYEFNKTVEDFLIRNGRYQALERRRKYYMTAEEIRDYITRDTTAVR
ncbi:MAG: hypothetical protein AAF944_05970 [Bacteroidota bacterium]